MYFQYATLEQETLPLSAVAFRRYVEKYQIEPLDVALKSGVPYTAPMRVRDKQEQADSRPGQKTMPPRKIQWK
jgi:hypothetical protein